MYILVKKTISKGLELFTRSKVVFLITLSISLSPASTCPFIPRPDLKMKVTLVLCTSTCDFILNKKKKKRLKN